MNILKQKDAQKQHLIFDSSEMCMERILFRSLFISLVS